MHDNDDRHEGGVFRALWGGTLHADGGHTNGEAVLRSSLIEEST